MAVATTPASPTGNKKPQTEADTTSKPTGQRESKKRKSRATHLLARPATTATVTVSLIIGVITPAHGHPPHGHPERDPAAAAERKEHGSGATRERTAAARLNATDSPAKMQPAAEVVFRPPGRNCVARGRRVCWERHWRTIWLLCARDRPVRSGRASK